ncbi:MAG: efflux RND transporter periplasmic adaptor subunit [Gammaproteobacteria bacterium]|nr:efflux RND transporter periplasmic adaptor subunit [Gammaproteobacteria bacterium]
MSQSVVALLGAIATTDREFCYVGYANTLDQPLTHCSGSPGLQAGISQWRATVDPAREPEQDLTLADQSAYVSAFLVGELVVVLGQVRKHPTKLRWLKSVARAVAAQPLSAAPSLPLTELDDDSINYLSARDERNDLIKEWLNKLCKTFGYSNAAAAEVKAQSVRHFKLSGATKDADELSGRFRGRLNLMLSELSTFEGWNSFHDVQSLQLAPRSVREFAVEHQVDVVFFGSRVRSERKRLVLLLIRHQSNDPPVAAGLRTNVALSWPFAQLGYDLSSFWRRIGMRLVGTGGRKLRLGWLLNISLIAALVAWLVLYQLQYRVPVDAIVQATEDQVVSSSVPGLVVEATKNLGDAVNKGDILIQLDTVDLQLRLLELEGERASKESTVNFSVAAGDLAQAELARADIGVIETKIAQIQSQIERSTIRSTLTGYVVSGERQNFLGNSVNVGERFYVVSPGVSGDILGFVPEREVDFAAVDMPVKLRRKGLDQAYFDARVSAIASVVVDANERPHSIPIKLDHGDALALVPGTDLDGYLQTGKVEAWRWIQRHAWRIWLKLTKRYE